MCAICATQLGVYGYVLGSYIGVYGATLVCICATQLGVYGVTQKGAQSVPDTDSGHTSDYKADIVLVEHQY